MKINRYVNVSLNIKTDTFQSKIRCAVIRISCLRLTTYPSGISLEDNNMYY